MNKKNIFFKFGLMVSVFSLMGVAFTSATSFKFTINTSQSKLGSISKNITPIHFADNGNDFGGFIYLSETDSNDGNYYRISGTVDDVEVEYECARKARGFYYNAERGEILWPLDETTWQALKPSDNTTLITKGGIYTLCRNAGYHAALSACECLGTEGCEASNGDVEGCVDAVDAEYPFDDSYAYYGKVTWIPDDNVPRVLILGMGYEDDNTNTWIIPNSKLDKTFVRFENKIPVGFVYDDNGGIGFAGCRITNGGKDTIKRIIADLQLTGMQDLFDYSGTNNDILAYTGNSDIRDRINCDMIGTAEDSLVNILIEGLVGLNRESTQGMQKNQSSDKMQYFVSANINNSTMINYAKRKSEILCRGKWNNNNDSSIVCLDNNSNNTSVVNAESYSGKTLIVKNRDVLIKPGNSESHYDIFVNSGNLIIEETPEPKAVFNNQGFYDSGITPESFAANFEGNENEYAGYSVGSFIKGNFIVDGKIKRNDGPIEHKYFIYGKLTSRDTLEELENLFAWRCRDGIGTDNTLCPEGTYAYASLVVINQNYDSPLMH